MGFERRFIKKHFPKFLDKIDDIGDRAEMLGDAQIESWKESARNNKITALIYLIIVVVLIFLIIKMVI